MVSVEGGEVFAHGERDSDIDVGEGDLVLSPWGEWRRRTV